MRSRSHVVDLGSSNDTREGPARHSSSEETASISSLLANNPYGPILLAAGPTTVYMMVSLILFALLRRRIPRVYSPRRMSGILLARARNPTLPAGWITWIKPLLKTPSSCVLADSSLDGFLFLRYLKVLCIICLAGIFLVWPVLLPIHMTGPSLPRRDALTIQGLDSSIKLYAHVAILWVYTGFILFMLWRESLYYINIRNAYLISSQYIKHKSSKTILITPVPTPDLDEGLLRKLFGDSVVRCWIPWTVTRLKRLVREREKTAQRLAEAEMTLTKTVNGPRTASLQISMPRWGRMTRQESPKVQGVKEGRMREKSRQPPRLTPTQSDVRISHSMVAVSSDGTHNSAHDHGSDFENVQTSPESQNMPATSRPEHPRVGGVCRSVDTIKWARSHLRLLNEQIDALRQQHHDDQGKKINAVFIEFDSYASAQAAYQTSIQYPPFQLSERVIGVRPGEVVWGSLGIKWWQRLVRQFLVLIVISACVILWWFPATIADAMTTPSTVKHYMPSVARLPPIATNIISGLGRSLLMVVLLEIIPIFMRACAKFSGAPTLSAIEMHVQSRYFVFQILQVFLGPILGLNIYHAAGYESILLYLLPNASSYYMTFILVRCLSTGAWELTQLWRLFRHKSRATRAGTQQTVYRRLHDLNVVHWGNVYPAIANIGVIAISYCCIAPLILAFAVTGLGFLHFVYKYNLIYVYDSNTLDTRGLFYPRALRHIIIGPYLAQFYFICRFVMVRAWGQLALTGLLSLFTVFLHNSVRSTMNPFDGLFRTPGHDVERASTQQNEPERDEHPHHEVGRRHRFSATEHLSNVVPKYVPRDATPVIANEACLSRRDQRQKTHRICGKWPRSLTLENPQSLHHIVSHVSADIKFPTQYEHQRYLPPEVWLPEPKLWIPRDETLMMSQGLAVTEAMLPTSDNGIWFEENGRVELDLELAPFKDDLLLYHHLRLIL